MYTPRDAASEQVQTGVLGVIIIRVIIRRRVVIRRRIIRIRIIRRRNKKKSKNSDIYIYLHTQVQTGVLGGTAAPAATDSGPPAY